MFFKKVAAVSVAFLLLNGCSSESDTSGTNSAQQPIAGNIHPGAIQIDGPEEGADLYADVGTPLNPEATLDWVLDALPNSGEGCLSDEAVASCVEPGITGADGGAGHWNGVRIVDGIAGDDLDIFVQGGKENETDTWVVEPGSVGSGKYDMVQAYLANNQTHLFFGMERRSNNGTTAFDFEFNQLAPMSLPECPQDPQIPCRSVDDVLFTFEMQGSGNTGSATPFIFVWDGTEYQPTSAEEIIATINDSRNTAGGPWGHVDSHGDWVLGDLDRFTFAEASAPLELLPGVDACGGSAYVQVRTRSSSIINSDLKDTSKVFEFNFLGLTPSASLRPSCEAGFYYEASASDLDGNPLEAPTCLWSFSNGETSTECSGFIAAPPGTYTATVVVSDPLNPECGEEIETDPVNVYARLAVVPTLDATCDLSFGYSATVTGGADPLNFVYHWDFMRGEDVVGSSIVDSGSLKVSQGNVSYDATVTVTETLPGVPEDCSASGSASVTPYAPLTIDLDLQAEAEQCPSMTSNGVTYDAVINGGNHDYTVTWHGQPCAGTSCTIDPSDGTFCDEQSVYATVGDSSGLCDDADSETETYTLVTTVTASNNP